MKAAGVVVLYNPDEKTGDNIASYLKSVDILYAVDNSSCDNSERFSDEKIVYIANMENLGIAEALNIGAKRAIEDGYEWLLTMDQDSRFADSGVCEMLEFIERMKEDAYLRKIVSTEYEKIGLVSPFHRMEVNAGVDAVGIDSPPVVMTSGNIINLKAYEKTGGFKSWMFIDAVDFDYCLNLRHNGYNILCLNFVELNHNLGKNTVIKKIGPFRMCTYNHNAVRRYYIVRNRHYFYDMYHEEFPDFCAHELNCTKKEVIKIILCEKEKIKKLKAMYRGYRDYKKGIKGKMPQK